MSKTYSYFDWTNERVTIEIDGERIVSVSDTHCSLCGCRLIVYSGDPHNVAECPNCGEFYLATNNEPDIEYHIDRVRQEMYQAIFTLNALNKKLNVYTRNNGNDVYKKNMDDVANQPQPCECCGKVWIKRKLKDGL